MLAKDLETNSRNSYAVNPQTWVSRYADYLYTYAFSRLNDEDLAKDLVQETFLAALQRKEKFEGRSTEKTWLTAILKNKIYDVYRSRSGGISKLIIETTAEYNDTGFFNQDDGHWKDQHNPAEMGIEHSNNMENKEFQKILMACMKKLPALWFSVFSMKHMDDEKTEAICEKLKLTSSNFFVIIHRTKVNLRSCLQKSWI